MESTIGAVQWLRIIEREYLDSFIKAGGSSVKFVVPLETAIQDQVSAQLIAAAAERQYLTAVVSATDTRAHMIDQLFFRLAEQIPWQLLSQRVLLDLAANNGYTSPPTNGPDALVTRIAAGNNADPEVLAMDARRWLGKDVLKRQSLAKDFRVAATQLCLAELTGGPEAETITSAIRDWFTGANRSLSAVKLYGVYSKINRSNARYLLISLLNWIRHAGYPGLLMVLDLSRLSVPKNPMDGNLFYSKMQVLDAFEVLRQFIDSTDRMKGFLLAVIASPEFLDTESTGRGMGAYSALKFRVYDEVHDQRLANPMGALVRLTPDEIAR